MNQCDIVDGQVVMFLAAAAQRERDFEQDCRNFNHHDEQCP